jgi:hypothetical protein
MARKPANDAKFHRLHTKATMHEAADGSAHHLICTQSPEDSAATAPPIFGMKDVTLANTQGETKAVGPAEVSKVGVSQTPGANNKSNRKRNMAITLVEDFAMSPAITASKKVKRQRGGSTDRAT